MSKRKNRNRLLAVYHEGSRLFIASTTGKTSKAGEVDHVNKLLATSFREVNTSHTFYCDYADVATR